MPDQLPTPVPRPRPAPEDAWPVASPWLPRPKAPPRPLGGAALAGAAGGADKRREAKEDRR